MEGQTRKSIYGPGWLVDSVVQDRSSKIEMMVANRPDVTIEDGEYLTCRCVCEECNVGWMSKLEAGTKPVLEPLIHDSSSPLDYVKQLALGMWATKTAMVYQCIKGETAFYSPADRQHLLGWNTPPSDTLIWIGRYENGFSLFAENHYLSNPENSRCTERGLRKQRSPLDGLLFKSLPPGAAPSARGEEALKQKMGLPKRATGGTF
jgi:hypothetical protein